MVVVTGTPNMQKDFTRGIQIKFSYLKSKVYVFDEKFTFSLGGDLGDGDGDGGGVVSLNLKCEFSMRSSWSSGGGGGELGLFISNSES